MKETGPTEMSFSREKDRKFGDLCTDVLTSETSSSPFWEFPRLDKV